MPFAVQMLNTDSTISTLYFVSRCESQRSMEWSTDQRQNHDLSGNSCRIDLTTQQETEELSDHRSSFSFTSTKIGNMQCNFICRPPLLLLAHEFGYSVLVLSTGICEWWNQLGRSEDRVVIRRKWAYANIYWMLAMCTDGAYGDPFQIRFRLFVFNVCTAC